MGLGRILGGAKTSTYLSPACVRYFFFLFLFANNNNENFAYFDVWEVMC